MVQPKIAVVMRSRNDGEIIERTLRALTKQTIPIEEILVLDNASTDNTRSVVKGFKSLTRIIHIPESSYIPGKVLNLGVKNTTAEFIVFLNSDAPPVHEKWLENLFTQYLTNAGVIYGRQIARSNAWVPVQRDYIESFPPLNTNLKPLKQSSNASNVFSIVCCLTSRRLVIETPIPENLQYSEDTAWSETLTHLAVPITYCANALVEHSHNYTFFHAAKRFYNEGVADRKIYSPTTGHIVVAVIVSPVKLLLSIYRDYQFTKREKLPMVTRELAHTIAFRVAQKICKPIGCMVNRFL